MSREFDPIADSYRDQVQEAIGFSGVDVDRFTARKADAIVDICRRHFAEPLEALRVLDVGCGVGLTDQHLVPHLGEVHGIDPSSESIAVARAIELNPEARYQSFVGDAFPVADEEFDVAFAVCVMHHVPPDDRATFARQLRRVVKPGGLVALFEHNPYNPLTRVVVNRCEFDRDAVLLRRSRSMELLERAGMTPVERRYITFLPFGRGRFERALAQLPLGAQYYVVARR